MKIGLCLVKVEGRGRFIGVTRLKTHPNEGDMRARLALHMGVPLQDVKIHIICGWHNMSEGDGMIGTFELDKFMDFVQLEEMHAALARGVKERGYKLEVRVRQEPSDAWTIVELEGGNDASP